MKRLRMACAEKWGLSVTATAAATTAATAAKEVVDGMGIGDG